VVASHGASQDFDGLMRPVGLLASEVAGWTSGAGTAARASMGETILVALVKNTPSTTVRASAALKVSHR
jgi:hypothetical protein